MSSSSLPEGSAHNLAGARGSGEPASHLSDSAQTPASPSAINSSDDGSVSASAPGAPMGMSADSMSGLRSDDEHRASRIMDDASDAGPGVTFDVSAQSSAHLLPSQLPHALHDQMATYEQQLLQFQQAFHHHHAPTQSRHSARSDGSAHDHAPGGTVVADAMLSRHHHHDPLSSLVQGNDLLQHQHQLQHQIQHLHHHHLDTDAASHHSPMGSVAGPGESLAATLAVQYQTAMHSAMPSLPPSLPTFSTLPPHHHGLPHGHHVLNSEDTETEANVGASTSSIGGDGESSYTPSVPLYCLCQQPYDGTSFMLACDNCNKWYHGKCVGVPEEEAKRGQRNGYICPSCAKSTPGSEVLRSMSLDVEDHDDAASMPSVHNITGEKRPREEAESLDTDHDGGDLLHSSGTAEGDLGGLGMVGAGAEEGEPAKKRRKSQMHQRGERLCRFPGCDKKISCRSYCSRHQKQKERCSKRGTIFSTSSSPRKSGSIGRPSKTFSQTRNQRQKLKRFDDKINDFAGGEQEGTAMLERYLNSSYGQKRLPSAKGDKTSQRIGQNAIQLVNQLPPTSPLRKPLIKALGQGLSQSEIADTFHVSRKTVERSFALSAEDNLLFSLVSRPRGSKPKEATDGALDAQQQEQLAQAGIYQTVRPPALALGTNGSSIAQVLLRQQSTVQSAEQQLELALSHAALPSSFTVEESGQLTVSTQPTSEVVAGDLDGAESSSIPTHPLLQSNVAVMMDTDAEDAPQLDFQSMAS